MADVGRNMKHTKPASPEPWPSDRDAVSSAFALDGPDDEWLARIREAERPASLGSLGSYELLEEVSRGGQGIVYRAHQPGTHRVFAVKRLLAGAFATPAMRARFEREIGAEISLSHPNIVGVHALEIVDNQPILAMEWIDGRPVDRWAAGDGNRADRDQILRTFLKICDAVHHAHRRGVIHRDLKPSNILVDEAGEPHVLDFGLAKIASVDDTALPRLTRTRQFVGTPAYAAPEQLRGNGAVVNVQSDVYALGVILHQMLTGRLPYPTDTTIAELLETIERDGPALLSLRERGLDAEIDAIVVKALAAGQTWRYQSVDAFASDVRRHMAGEPIDATLRPHAPRRPVLERRGPGAIAPDLPDFDLIRLIGAGGMGKVWLARNRIDRHYYAVKVFPAGALVEIEGLREYKHRVAEHPHLVPIEHVGRVGDLCYYAMPLADDASATSPVLDVDQYEPLTLASALQREGSLPLDEVLAIGKAILAALDHLHCRGVRHGDVKPGNILKVHGRWQLADHGLVSAAGQRAAGIGTPGYCPPEGPGGRETDLYALGRTLSEAAAGDASHRVDALLAGARPVSGADPRAKSLALVIRRACAADPGRRFARAEEMRQALLAVERRGARPPWYRRWRPVTGVAAVLLVLASVAVLVTSRGAASVLDVEEDLCIVRHDEMGAVVGQIGFGSASAIEDERVTVEVAFDRPAYCFVIAFNPDGTETVCFPASGDERPATVRSVEAPRHQGEPAFYRLSDGAGTQAFVVVASTRPLPVYETWRGRLEGLAWEPTITTGAWAFDGRNLVPIGRQRGTIEPPGDRPVGLASLCRTIQARGEAEVVRAVAFPVVPRAAPRDDDSQR